MKYTIDVEVDAVWTTHRLKKDGTFKNFTGKHMKEILEDDFTFDNFYEATHWISNHNFIEVEGKKIEVNPTISNLTDPTVSVRHHRMGKPKQSYFSIEELKEVLLSGDDSHHNSLVIDYDGFVHLVPFDQAKNGAYAVRFETFIAGNGYVGNKSSLNDIEDTYLALLQGWASHLYSHDKVYQDYTESGTIKETLDEINEAINNL
jgi:hypothetical protein